MSTVDLGSRIGTTYLMTFRPCPIFALAVALIASISPVSPTAASPPSPADPVAETAPPDSALQGVVWTPPRPVGPSLGQLNRISATGATAVRLTRLPTADTVFTRADSLGLHLYLDLPVSYVSGSALEDSLRAARPVLDRILTLAAEHPSVEAVGLARYADTSVPSACSTLRAWTARVHDRAPSLQTYYVTPFTAAADRCEDAVDRPLLDLRGHPQPLDRLDEWRSAVSKSGIGALGTWVHPGGRSGLRAPHSPERQARYLERTLGRLLDTVPTSSLPLFVYRWQDRASPTLPTRRYGLHTQSGIPRPAARVLEGFYRGIQRVFAFPAGVAPSTTPLGPLLIGWGLIALLGGLYAQSPFMRKSVSRYFLAHGFYRDAVATGREVGATVNTILLFVVVGALGTIGTLAARIALDRPATGWIVEAFPAALRAPLTSALTHPFLMGLLAAAVSLILLLGWCFSLVLVGRRGGPFTLSQALMLVTWPCWPVLLGMLIALVAATHPPVSLPLLGLLLLAGGLATAVAVTVRVLRDFLSVSRVSLPWAVLLLIPSPLVVTGGAVVLLSAHYGLPLSLLWHLLTRT